MIEIEKPQIECIETPGDASYGKYVIEPLERGYGTTLGNALRRIMLSSLPGTAATSIKIAGVQHEFSTIPGVKEDVTEIVLNVKSLLTKLHCEGTKTVYIEATGPCEVTAGDIKSDGEVEVLNPELHLATLDVGATLSMEITLSHGRGYVSADRNKAQRPGVIGVIPIDSIYTPVYKVNYTVENTRVGSMSDFDKLTLEVWTDSTISARDAVSLGAKILCDHFALFTDLSDTLDGRPIVVEKSADPQSTVLDMTIEELDLSVRSFNCLKRANINTVADLISKTEDEMFAQMVDIIIVAQAILQMHIIVDGSQDIFLGNMLGYQFMYVLLDCFCQLLGIIAELFQDLGQNRIVYQFMDTEILGIAIYIVGQIYHQIRQYFYSSLFGLDIYEGNCAVLDGICQLCGHLVSCGCDHFTGGRIHYICSQDLMTDTILQS